ncbi:uncharacterized protein PHACADRAFT_185750 [Phanerochaete carnosa HHB-10118-sp]|uniref:RGS1/SST2-like Fungal-Differentiation Regulator domain-containing protein n=1 Tax=Phanerochaete carnosa (strain HHB-10118-sp) TaxID=650164 RepID=K5W7I6_PHACS|nr:uncharacterized protein PHACADRAFT_185750 [Phanerochaete carnosa HHB-10118-sp]EKM54924.1 hypothetical protein PHACADRAFT_185750 [Phanerochaete carnosa HHB-10118-sp]
MAPTVVKTGAASSRKGVLKVTKAGRPFLRSLLNIYATFALALPLHTTYRWFTKYNNAFVFDEAMRILADLKVSQRLPGPQAPAESGVAAAKTVAYSFAPDAARRLCELFMAARLVEAVTDPQSRTFVRSSVYTLTPKGLHVVEQFAARSGGESFSVKHNFTADGSKGSGEPAVVRLLAVQPVCTTLLHLVRRWDDDEVVISATVVRAAFRQLAGRTSNRASQASSTDAVGKYNQYSAGVPLVDSAGTTPDVCFKAPDAVNWLLDLTSLLSVDEAGNMLAHCVRLGLVEVIRNGRRRGAKVYTAQGVGDDDTDSAAQVSGEFRLSATAVYRVTEEGRRAAGWGNLTHIPGQSETCAANFISKKSGIPLLASSYSTPSALPHSDEERHGGVYVTRRETCMDS